VRAFILTICACLLSAASAVAAPYDAFADFTTANNPGAVWTYASAPNPTSPTTLLPFQYNDATLPGWMFADPSQVPYPQYAPYIRKNVSGSEFDDGLGTVYPADELVFEPGGPDQFNFAPINDAVLVFTAPAAGSYTFTGLFQGLAPGGRNPSAANQTSTDVHVIDSQGNSVLDAAINGFGDTEPFDFTTALQPGDTVRFVVGLGNGSINSDSTGFKVHVDSVVPEPLSLALFGIPCAALLHRRRLAKR
jgi:hypothetical protein